MKKKTNSLLTEMQKHFGRIARDTIRALGKDKANFFVTLWNDAFVINDAIDQAYRKEELSRSLVWFRMETMTFSAELYWLHFLFSAGNYALVFPRLRFLWEMIYRAYYADTYQKQSTSDLDKPGPSLDEKSAWLEKLEEDRRIVGLGLINRVLSQVFPLARTEKQVADYYRGCWKHVSTYAHPSNPLLEKMIDREGMILNRFSAEWANETIDVTTTIFDLMWLAVIGRFPECAAELAKSGLGVEYPVTQSILGKVIAG